MPRTPLALALAVGVLVAAPGTAAAAPADTDCRTPDLTTATDRVDVVLLGRVTGSETRTERSGGERTRVREYTVDPERIYRGRVETAPVTVTGPAQALGVIPDGQRWVLLVSRSDSASGSGSGDELTVEPCSWSREANQSVLDRVQDALGNGRAFQEAPAEPAPLSYTDLGASDPLPLGRLVAPGVAVTIVGLLGLVLFRRRPR